MALFFFSYARDDAVDAYLRTFYEDLRLEVSVRAGVSLDEAGFLDVHQPTGREWAVTTSAALGECKVYVPVYSPNFFDSEYCGQEWHTFMHRRSRHHQSSGKEADGVTPVWWLPPRRLPTAAERFQDTRDQFDADHRRYGLRYLLQLKENESKYRDVVVKLTDKIIDAAGNAPAQHAELDLLGAPNAFVERPNHQVGGDPDGARRRVGGLRRVTFVLVAAGREEMRPVRAGLETYGQFWDEWRPYYPTSPEPIVWHAQSVANKQKLVISEPRPADAGLLDFIGGAETRNEIVVVIIDPWSTALTEYANVLRQLNGRRFGNTTVIVPWEAGGLRDPQRRNVLYACLGNWVYGGGQAFRDNIQSMKEFERILGQALRSVRAAIVEMNEVARRAEEPGPGTRPILTGPGG